MAIAVLLGLWMVAAAWSLLSAASSLRAGGDRLQEVRQRADIEALTDPATVDELARAEADLAAAHRRLSGPFVAPTRLVPVLGRHVRAADRLAVAGRDGAAAAGDAVVALGDLAGRPNATGEERLATLAELAVVGERAERRLAALEVGDPDGLTGGLADAVTRVGDQQRAAVRGAGQLAAAADALAGVLRGPEPYLLLGANNAEMRNGTGMYLSAGELAFDDGDLALGEVRPTAELVRPEGSVPVAGDLARNWPWLDVGRDLRNLGLSADLPQSLPVAARNWEGVPGGGPVAGVIAVDVDGLRSLLRAVGPVEVDGVRYTADTVRGELLRDQYARYDDDRTARRDQLGAVAGAVFDRIAAGEWELPVLARELADAVQGRHLVIWSADARTQEAWDDLGATGALGPRSLSAALVNRGATKLDSWIDQEVEVVTSAPEADGTRRIEVTLRIRNRAPATGPRYVVGPNVEGVAAGDHVGLAVVNLPAGSTGLEMGGARTFLVGGDGPTEVIAGEVRVPRGTSVSVTVRGVLPAGVDRLTLEPSARVPRTGWIVDGTTFERDRRRTVDLGT